MSMEENLGSILGAQLMDMDGQHPGMGILGWFAGRQVVRSLPPRITSARLDPRGVFIVRGKGKREDIAIGAILAFNAESLVISRVCDLPKKWGEFLVEALPYRVVAEHIADNGSYEFAAPVDPPTRGVNTYASPSNAPALTFDPRDRW